MSTPFRMDSTPGAGANSSAAPVSPRSPLAASAAPGTATYAAIPVQHAQAAAAAAAAAAPPQYVVAPPPAYAQQYPSFPQQQQQSIPMAIPISPQGTYDPQHQQAIAGAAAGGAAAIPVAIPVGMPGMMPTSIEILRVAPRSSMFRLAYPTASALISNPSLEPFFTSYEYQVFIEAVNRAADVGSAQAASLAIGFALGLALFIFGFIVFYLLFLVIGAILIAATSSVMRVQRVRALARVSLVLDSFNPSFMDGATRRKMPFFATLSAYYIVFMTPSQGMMPPMIRITAAQTYQQPS